MFQNFKELGLCRDVNKESIRSLASEYKARIAGAKVIRPTKNDGASEPGRLHDALTEIQNTRVVMQPALPSSMPVQEQCQIAALIRKYGADNLDAMARDIKLNVWQKTAAQLKKRVALYLKLQEL